MALGPKTWAEVQDAFLRGMEGFDQNVATGAADMGDLQNGKEDFFNDLLALILENCAQVQLFSRAGVPGLICPKHNLDAAFPSTGVIEFILDARVVGKPKHPGSPHAKAIGRAGSAGLDKQVKEIGFKIIDLKATFSRSMAARGESPSAISGDLTARLRLVRPKSYIFFAARVISDEDRDAVIHFADLAGRVGDAVGVFCFRPVAVEQPTRYKADPVPSHVELGRVLFRACEDLTAMRGSSRADPEPARQGS